MTLPTIGIHSCSDANRWKGESEDGGREGGREEEPYERQDVTTQEVLRDRGIDPEIQRYEPRKGVHDDNSREQ